MLTPLLTEADPAETSEGSIDPLGLYSIADALVTRLVPGVRERQKHPRFLTAIAVGWQYAANLWMKVRLRKERANPGRSLSGIWWKA